MIRTRGGTICVLVTVLILMVAPIAGLSTSTTTQATTSPDTFSVTDDVSVWQGAPLPFRLNTDDAAKTLNNGALDVNYQPENTGPISARKGKTAVYQAGQPIDATFQSVSGAGTGAFNGNTTQLVVARIEPNESTSTSTDLIPTSLGEARDFFDTDAANSNATFLPLQTPGQIQNGSLSTAVTFPESGTYALFLATGSNLSVSNGDLSVNGQTTIVGMDAAVVEESPADASLSDTTVTRGDDASFTVTPQTSGTSNVSVLVYDTSTWTNSQTTVVIEDQINSDLSAENVTIRHSIAEVNGVAEFDGSVSMLGMSLGSDSRSGTFSAGSVIEFVVDRANDETSQSVSQPDTIATDTTALDASLVTEANISGQTTINVPTFANWTTGDYTYVVVTGGNDDGDIHTKTGALTIQQPDTGQPSQPPTGPPPSEPSEPPAEEPDRVEGAAPGSGVTSEDGRKVVSITGTTPGSPVRVNLSVTESELETNGVGLTSFQFSTSQNTSASLTVTTPATVDAPPVSSTGDLGYIQIEESVDPSTVSAATYTFAVSDQRLQDRGVAPDDVALYRYQDGSWTQLETTLVETTGNRHVYESESPGLSLYAVSTRSAAQEADIEVTNADVSPTEVTVGDTIDVTATLENTGNAEGTFEAALQVDGSTVTTKQVTVPAGETTQVTFEHTFTSEGEYEVAVSGTTAGTVTVSPADTTTTTTTTTTSTTAPPVDDQDDDGGNILLYSFLVLLLIGVLAAAAYLYSQGYFDEYLNQR